MNRSFLSFLFPTLLGVSIALHGVILGTVRFPAHETAKVAVHPGETVVLLVQEEVPEPKPEILPPEPEPPEPEPEPEPEPVEEILVAEASELPPAPVATPTPHPTPVPTPTPLKKPAPPQTKPAPPRQERVAPSGAVVVARPNAPRNRPPAYPEHARRQGWEGQVLVRASVDANGRVSSVTVVRSSGYGILDQAALRAVRGWTFHPQTVGGEPRASAVEVPVNFSLRR